MTLQLIYEDNFSYPDGELAATGNWELHNTSATQDQWVISSEYIALPAVAARRSCQIINELKDDQWASVNVYHEDTAASLDFGVGLCFGQPSLTENHYRFIIRVSSGGAGSTVRFAITKMVNGIATDLISTGALTRSPSPFNLRGRKVGNSLFLDINNNELLTVTDDSLTGGVAGVTGYSGGMVEGWKIDDFRSGNIISDSPEIDPAGTDTNLVNGSSQKISFTGLTATPTSVALVHGGNVFTQPNFSIGAIVAGGATANFTAAIGNLPYTSTAYPASGFSYLVTNDNGTELTLSGITINPSSDRSVVTAVNPINDSTSIIPSWLEGGAVTGDQIDWPKVVGNIQPTVNPDFTHSGTRIDDNISWPDSITFTINYWDSITSIRYAVTVEVAYAEDGTGTVIGITTRELTTRSLTVRNLTMRSL